MIHLRKTTCSLLLILGLNLPLIGQTMRKNDADAKQAQTTSDNNKKAVTADQKQALLMLEPLFVATNDLKHDRTRVYLRAQIADTLWEYNEARARQLFEKTLRNTGSGQSGKSANQSADSQKLDQQLYGELVRHWIAERDPVWATQIALKYLTRPGQNKPDNWMLEILASTDPQRAAQIMKQCIERKEAVWLERFLTDLRRKDELLADDLFTYALTVGPQRGSTPLDHFQGLFTYVFPASGALDMTSPTLNAAVTKQHFNPDTTSPLNAALIKQYFDFGYKTLMTEAGKLEQKSRKNLSIDERAGVGYASVIQMLPYFDKYMPEATPEILARWDQVILTLEDGKELISQVNLLFRRRSSQERLNQAEQTKDELEKQLLYGEAVYQYLFEANFDQAASILSKMDDAGRSGMEQDIHIGAAKFAIASGNIDSAYRHSREVKYLRSRIDLLCQVAQLLQNNKESDRALKIINEAEKSIEKEENGADQITLLFMVANAATRLQPARGFEMTKSAIEAFNRDRRPNSEYSGAVSYDLFDDNLLLLAKTDFARSLELAKPISPKAAYIAAQVAVCRGVLLQN
jgi:hypothetical protein